MATLVFNHEEIAARGWAWTAYDWDEQRLFNYLGDTQNTYPIWNATPLVALDVYEHAYFLDYQTDRASYIDAFFANLDWATVNDWVQRYQVPLREGLASEPVGDRRVRGRLCACQLRAQLAHGAVPLGDHVVRVDRLQVDLAREEEVSIAQCRIGVQHSLQREADRVLHEARLEVRVLDDEQLVRALEELEDRSAHRRLDDLAELLRIHPRVAADEQRPDPTLVVRRERDELEDALDVARREARLEQAVSRALPDEALRAGAGVDPRRLDSDHPPDAALRGRRDPDQSEHRLGGEARHGRVALDGVPRSDPRLRPAGALPLDDLARDVRRQLLDEERLLEHDVLDHLLEELREAGHVDALLRRVEVDGALDVSGDQLLAGPVPDPDRLRHPGDPRARQAEANLGLRCLEVFAEQVAEIGHPDGIMAVAPDLRTRMASQSIFAQLVSLACHDLRTPLATASGFAHTLQRLDSPEEPADRYVDMIGAASEQMTELLDLLGAAARIEAGRFDVQAREADSRKLVDAAVARLDGHAVAEGGGATVQVDPPWAEKALASLAECVRRHGAFEQVTLAVDGAAVSIGPVADGVGAIALGDDLKDFGAAVGSRVLDAMGAELKVEGERLVVRFPQA